MLVQVAVPGPFPDGLSYLYAGEPDPSLIGRRVLVPLRKREVVAVVDHVAAEADAGTLDQSKLKSVIDVIDTAPVLPAALQELIRFMRHYYHVSIGDAYDTALPRLIAAGNALKAKPLKSSSHGELLDLNPEQQAIVSAIEAEKPQSIHLIEGVTGSGKTEVYLHCVAAALERGEAVLVLVPEIGLTPQTLARFEQRLGYHVAAYHSGLTEAQKRNCWVGVQQGEVQLVVGTRSAVFLPFQNLGLVVVDEEHDQSYKQQTGVHYSAKSLALMRGKQEQARVILGSATPSVESFYLAKTGVYLHHILKNRAIAKNKNRTTVVDMRKFKVEAGLSHPFLEAMRKQLAVGHQVLIFLNRRGYAPILMCSNCGERTKCPACEMSYTLHQSPRMLICHHCGRMAAIPNKCQLCQGQLITLGLGTEQLEEYLAKHFAEYAMLRLDQDATRKKGELEEKLEAIRHKQVQIIIGTQMLAKGHDFLGIAWVGVVDLDYGFFAPDFRGIERTGQLLTQVAGRAGRGEIQGEVMIQTHVPEHPLLQKLLKEGYAAFAAALLEERKLVGWPPFAYLALLRAESKSNLALERFLKMAKTMVQTHYSLSVLGPIPAFVKKKNNYHRAQILLESGSRKTLHLALACLESLKAEQKNIRFWIDVDPIEVG